MSLIKIFANNIELDIVKETLTITKENNSLINDFKVSYSNFPFLIVENSNTKKALGGRDITTTKKPKVVKVIVEELNEKYYGELQIMSYLNGFRKVTLKYATELLQIMETNIASFMPVVSVIPDEINPVPFSEESESIVPGYDNWANFVPLFANKSYPDTKYNFPMMSWKNKFGVDLQPDDPWILFKQHINYFDENGVYLINIHNAMANTAEHTNVPAPQVFLLSPLWYALQSLGWSMTGDFVNSDFVQKILILSTKNNLCKTKNNSAQASLNYSIPVNWTIYPLISPTMVHYNTYKITLNYTFPSAGKYLFSWMFKITDNSTDGLAQKKTYAEITGQTLFVNFKNGIDKVYSGTIELDVAAGTTYQINFYSLHQNMPNDYSLSFLKLEDAKDFYEFHPTIELGRYVPDWSFGTYITELKRLFNLKIDIDDFRKKLTLNFNEGIIEDSKKENLKKSLAKKDFDQPIFDAFHLKFQNDTDTGMWISASGAELYLSQKSDFSEKLESKFKFVPRNGYTSELSEELESKDGVGLMIYDTDSFPFISSTYNNQTLAMNGQKGIYEMYWKKWLKFRLNASHIELTGYFTEIELSKIQKIQRIYIDRQDYLVSSLEYSQTEQSNFEVLLKLESVNY